MSLDDMRMVALLRKKAHVPLSPRSKDIPYAPAFEKVIHVFCPPDSQVYTIATSYLFLRLCAGILCVVNHI